MVRIDIYHTYQQYEWATAYWMGAAEPASPADVAEAIATLEADLVAPAIEYNRWEMIVDGAKVDEGGISGVIGTFGGQMLPLNYCALLRLTSTGPQRPSVKYIHGITEDATTPTTPGSTWPTELFAYSAGLVSLGVKDSDGFAISGAIFRKWSRRKRIRRLP